MSRKSIFVIGVFSFIVVLMFFCLYFYQFHGSLSSKHAVWADFGSYVGGTISAIFASLSFLVLLYTVCLQRDELTLAIQALEDGAEAQKKQAELYEAQKFESTFYSLLDTHNRIALSLGQGQGGYHKYSQQVKKQHSRRGQLLTITMKKNEIQADAELSQYFRVLYQLLKFVCKNNIKNKNKVFNESDIGDRKTISLYENEEKMYASLVRSFVPREILPLLALYCAPTTDEPESMRKFHAMLERYAFLEHMDLKPFECNRFAFDLLDSYAYALGDRDELEITHLIKHIQLSRPYAEEHMTEGNYLHSYHPYVDAL